MSKVISISELRRRFSYHRRGYLLRKVKTAPNTFVGQKVTGHSSGKNTHGPEYKRLKIGKCSIPFHVAIFAIVKKRFPKTVLDHKNRNAWDNRIENLREATGSQNRFNCILDRRNKSGHRGVFKQKGRPGWRVILGANNKYHYFGHFKKKSDAIIAQRKAIKKLHGSFKVRGTI